MDTSKMLTQMCQQVLSGADIKAICKSRGFSAREASSRTVFENYLLSDIGLETALASLSREEVILLHLLKLEGRAVDVRFFARLSPQKPTWHNSFTQRYSPIFKAVQSSLIRKGVLLIAAAPGAATKMEGWRFHFPREFAAFLPSIFRTTVRFQGEGDIRRGTLRQRVMSILKDHGRMASHDKHEYPVTLTHGQLLIENRPFSVNALLHWREAHWQRSVWRARGQRRSPPAATVKIDLEPEEREQKPFPPLLNYAYSQLDADEWVPGDELSMLLRLFYHGVTPPNGKEVCEAGWELGCLAKHTVQGKDYYRLAPLPTEADEDPTRYLTFTADSSVCVDLETIPYQSLECLAAIAELQVVGARLIATPHPIKLGRAPEAVWKPPLIGWLRNNSTAFRKAIETIEARRGKQIIHANLLLAKVKDLSLKVELQKAFSDPNQLVVLPNDFVAFPTELLGDIQRLIGKSGYVVKTIRTS